MSTMPISGRVWDVIAEMSSSGLLLFNPSGQVIAVNSRCEELLGFTRAQLLGRPTTEVTHQMAYRVKEPSTHAARMARHFERPDQPFEDLLEIERPRRRVVKRHSAPVMNGSHVEGRVFTYTDVTAEVDMDRMKSEFVAVTSHELRTPLTSVHGALQLVLSGGGHRLDPEDRELLEISLHSTERLVRLVNDLLDLAKIEAGRMPMERLTLPVHTLVRDAVSSLRAMAGSRRVTLAESVGRDVPDIVGDRDQLTRVLTNLINNAIKYSPENSRVTVGAAPGERGVKIWVDDEGPGIPEDQIDLLFKPFARVGDQERQAAGGTGLGLAISRAIVEQHAGQIGAKRLSRGSRFVFELPEAKTAQPAGALAEA